MMKKITVEMLRSWNACYWDDADAVSDPDDYADMREKCEAALPATPLQIAKAEWVPVQDRLWVLLREPFFDKPDLHELACAAHAHAAAAYNAAAAYDAYDTAAYDAAAAAANERRAQLNLVIAKLG